ncbi:MAG TPA: MFS transporter [Verrucomicrobiae bacterium]|nr:MFS transporter [Verrucomicrobiae bacterium]
MTRYRYRVLAVLCSLAFLTYLDRICIMRVQGDIERDLRLGEITLQGGTDPGSRVIAEKNRATERMSWVFSAFVAGYVLFEVPGGWLGDRFGARAVIFRIVLCWSVFTAATGGVKWITGLFFSKPGPEQWLMVLVCIRFLFGVGEAGAYPNIARALGRWFPFHERASAQSFIWLASRFGGAFAPAIIGGLMLFAGGWQRAFWILGAIGILWAILFFIWFRDRPEDKSQVNESERALIRSGEIAPANIYADEAIPAFRWASLFSPNILALCLVSFCVSFCFYFYITFLPKYLKEQFHVDYADSQFISGLPLLLGGLACLGGGFLSDYAIRRTGSKRWGRSIIPIVGWTGAGLCAFAVSQLESALAVITLIVVAFALQDLGVPSMWSLPTDIGGRFAGTVGGWMNSAGGIGGMLSPLVAAKVSFAHGWNATFIVFGAVYLLGALAWLRVDASSPIRHECILPALRD